MNLILRQTIGYEQGKRTASLASADPELKRQLEEAKKALNSILNKWSWNGQNPRTSTEFLNRFELWINEQLKEQKDLKEFLERKGVNNLTEAESKLTNRDLSENEELTQLREELASQEQTFLNTEQEYLSRIAELQANQETGELSEVDQEKLANYDSLETERDELKRANLTLEQEITARGNQVRNKNTELTNRDKEITRLKKAASEKEKTQQQKLKGIKSDLEKAKKDHEELKKKYSKQGQLLDGEQVENGHLTNKVEELEAKIRELERRGH